MEIDSCVMCSMPLKTPEERQKHLWDMVISCDEIASELEHDTDKNQNAISQIYALKECISQLKQFKL